MSKLSAHFSSDEFKCPCCGACNVDAKLLLALEDLRKLVGSAITVSSGYRCAKQNAAEGGAQSSLHLKGQAADILCPKSITLAQFYTLANKVPAFANGGIGVYPKGAGQNVDFLHVDVRPAKARWARVNKKYVSVDQGLTFKKQKGEA